jgi:hypothetical protein
MFKGLIFVVLAAFVAFGATLFMATKDMEARLISTAPAGAGNMGKAVEAAESRRKKNRGKTSAGQPQTSGKKRPGSSATPVVTPMSKAPASVDRPLVV